MVKQTWRAVVTAIGLCSLSVFSYGFDWTAENHDVLIGDFGSDSTVDIYLQPRAQTTSADLPYDIAIDLELMPNLGHSLLVNDGSLFSLQYSDTDTTVGTVNWTNGDSSYIRHFADFNGDGYQDVLLQPQSADDNGVVILGFEPGGQPTVFQTLTSSNLNHDISASTTISLQDINDDGRADIRFQSSGQPEQVAVVDINHFTQALTYPLCTVSNGETDSDCDGTSDRYDISKYNSSVTSKPEDNIKPVTIGTIPGSFAVSPDGKAVYNIPITLVPGITSVQPNISLHYNQHAGNGLLGMGWNINGLSEISRCATTLDQDGYINGVNFNSSDRYCLNGQRLIEIAPNEYRTENESFSKIIASGNIAGSPQSFTVYKASGEIETYGGTTSSRRQVIRNGAVHTWALSRIEDREGNFSEYLYRNIRGNGEFYIMRINYNNRSVVFEYENRSDVTANYANSIYTYMDERLRYIKTYLGSTQVRQYELFYEQGESERSLLSRVRECLGSGSDCLNDTVFSWDLGLQNNESHFSLQQTNSPPGGALDIANHRYHMGDVNADGFVDIVWTYRNQNALSRVVYLADGEGSFTQQSTQTDNGYFAAVVDERDQHTLMSDINGDGKSDLIWVARHLDTVVRNIYLANSEGTGFVSQGYEVEARPHYSEILQSRFHTVDVNGDGLNDLVWTYHHNNQLSINTYLTVLEGSDVSLGSVSVFEDRDFSPDFYLNNNFSTGDVNGDGKTDLVWSFSFQNYIYRTLYLANAAGDGFVKISLGRDEFNTADSDHQMSLGDVNGDGKADLVWTYNRNSSLYRTVYLASRLGTSFEEEDTANDSVLNFSGHSGQQSRLSDINGDGRQDLVYSYISNTNFGWVTYLADMDGEGFTRHSSGSHGVDSGTENHQYNFGDITGDGKADLVWTYNTSTGSLRRLSFTQQQSYPDHIESITDGLGNTTEIEYSYLANSTNYSQGEIVSYPYRNDTGLSYVVTRVEKNNGIGGTNTWDYQYSGARTHLRGRGFVGFETRTVIENERGLSTEEHYLQEFPFVGDLEASYVRSGDIVIDETHNDWRQVSLNSAANTFRYLYRQGIERRNLNDGATYYGAVIVNQYNNTYGYLDTVTTTTGRAYDNFVVNNIDQSVVTNYDYNIHHDNWRIRFIREESKTHSAPGESNRTIVNQFTPHNDNSLLTETETDFVGTDIEQTRTYSRDTYGNVLTATITGTDIDGGTITPQQDSVNRYIDGIYAEDSTNAEEHVESALFDHRYGYLTKATDANDLVTDVLTDGYGHQLYSRASDGTEVRHVYEHCSSSCPSNAVYSVTTNTTHKNVTKAGAPRSTTYFDIKQRPIATQVQNQSGGDVWTQTTYDALGRVERKSQPYLAGDTIRWINYEYDKLDRVIEERRPDGGVTQTDYLSHATYGSESVVTATVANPIATSKTLVSRIYTNSVGQMMRSLDAQGTRTDFEYDALGNVREIIVDNNAATTVTIIADEAGNKRTLTDPDAGIINYEYDAVGRERRRTYGVGADEQTTVSYYDRLNRLTRRVDNDGTNDIEATWTYDEEGALGTLNEVNGTDFYKKHNYDHLTRLSNLEIRLLGETTAKEYDFAYDDYSRPLVTVYPSNLAILNEYDKRGYHTLVRNAETDKLYWQANSRDVFGNVDDETFGNGVTTTQEYDRRTGRIVDINTGISNKGNAFQSLNYIHDSAGNLVRRTTTRNNAENTVESFTYDNLHRLHSANTRWLDGQSRSIDFRYDTLGNIQTKSDVSDTNGYSYGANGGGVHAVSRVTQGGQTTDYGYDFKGNMITRGSQIIDYSVFNKPTRIFDLTAETRLRYGPSRNRYYQWTNNNGEITETRYYGNGFEIANRGDWIRERTTVGGFLVITRVSHTTDATISEDLDYLHRDHLGSLEATSDRFGNFTGRFAFDPWGKRRKDDWTNADAQYEASIDQRTFESTTRGFTDHEHLDAVGLIHMNGRVYDPRIGRFLSPDDYVQVPENSQSYNRYTYVLNNPLSYTDPSGEFIPLIIAGAVLAVKAYDAYSTAKDVHDIVVDDNLSKGQKALAVGGMLALSFVPGSGAAKKVYKSRKKLESFSGGGDKAKALDKNKSAGDKKAAEGTGTDKNTERKAENKDTGCGCFAPGTLVLTEEGLKAIETIQIGDRVAAKSDITQDIAWKAIEKIYHYENREYFSLILAGQDGAITLTTTNDHPFWIEGLGWVRTQDLQLGDLVQSKDGETLEVIHWESQGYVGETFNFEVEGYHTFFVGEEGIWVHNGGPCDENETLFRGDNNYRGGDIGTPKTEITAEDIINHVLPDKKSKADSPFVSFSTKKSKGSSESRGAGFFGKKVVKTESNAVDGEIITPEKAFEIISKEKKKKIRNMAGPVKRQMELNNERLVNGVVSSKDVTKIQ